MIVKPAPLLLLEAAQGQLSVSKPWPLGLLAHQVHLPSLQLPLLRWPAHSLGARASCAGISCAPRRAPGCAWSGDSAASSALVGACWALVGACWALVGACWALVGARLAAAAGAPVTPTADLAARFKPESAHSSKGHADVTASLGPAAKADFDQEVVEIRDA